MLNVGDIVYLKSDLNRALPMVVVNVEEVWANRVGVEWLNDAKQVVSRFFSCGVLVCALPTEEQARHYEKFEILRAGEFFGLYGYDSLIAQNFAGSTDFANETRLVYEFKKHNTKASFFEERVRLCAFGLGCEDILAVPPHLPHCNNLQLLFGEKIRRVKEVTERKYTHKEALPANYADSYLINTSKIVGNKILLIDDVITSGFTIRHFAGVLEGLGFEVVMFGLGVRKKLKPVLDRTFCFLNVKNG